MLGISLNLGIRHILPLYPFLLILAGGWAVVPWRQRVVRPALLVALLVQLVSVLLVYPNFLAYFNEAAGGADHGYKVLIDSNLDWGQDIGQLARLQRERQLYPLAFSYFGTTPPEAYGLACTPLAGSGVMHHAPAPDWKTLRGFVAVSVTNLYGGRGYAGADYRPLRALTPYARAGKTIVVYQLPPTGLPPR